MVRPNSEEHEPKIFDKGFETCSKQLSNVETASDMDFEKISFLRNIVTYESQRKKR